jgi:hypothetical protein
VRHLPHIIMWLCTRVPTAFAASSFARAARPLAQLDELDDLADQHLGDAVRGAAHLRAFGHLPTVSDPTRRAALPGSVARAHDVERSLHCLAAEMNTRSHTFEQPLEALRGNAHRAWRTAARAASHPVRTRHTAHEPEMTASTSVDAAAIR